MFQFNLVITHAPVAKARPRFTRSGVVYSSKETLAYEKLVKTLAREQMSKLSLLEPSDDSLEAHLTFYRAMPPSWSNKKKKEKFATGNVSRPDIDNLAKIILDSLNGIVYVDDAQVYKIFCTKLWAISPATHVLILGDTGRNRFETIPNYV